MDVDQGLCLYKLLKNFIYFQSLSVWTGAPKTRKGPPVGDPFKVLASPCHVMCRQEPSLRGKWLRPILVAGSLDTGLEGRWSLWLWTLAWDARSLNRAKPYAFAGRVQ
jgi:hypothetical protein